VGDFNGDGIPDLAVANQLQGTGRINILLGNGDGSFQAIQSYSVGAFPTSVAVADLNGDGILDLALVNDYYPNGTLSILLGNGDGSFQAPSTYVAGNFPASIAVGDFNGDGIPDLAVAADEAHIFIGNGDGTFQAAQSYAPGGFFVVVGDFNGDGHLDLAVEAGFGVAILLGTGDGSFRAMQIYAAENYSYLPPPSLVAGDYNGDGIPDLAVTNPGSTTVSVLLGQGDGSFRAAPTHPVESYAVSVAVGDFNGDGVLDLAVANDAVSAYSGTVNILLGKATARSNPLSPSPLGWGPPP
jgi:hypothetical protein